MKNINTLLNLNLLTALFLLIIALLFLLPPNGISGIVLFAEVFAFSIYTLNRMNRKEWNSHTITKQERGRVVYLIAIYAVVYCCVMGELLINHRSVLDTLSHFFIITDYLQVITLNYVVFQIHLELNSYRSKDYSDEGFLTRLLKGRMYRQSNSKSEEEEDK